MSSFVFLMQWKGKHKREYVRSLQQKSLLILEQPYLQVYFDLSLKKKKRLLFDRNDRSWYDIRKPEFDSRRESSDTYQNTYSTTINNEQLQAVQISQKFVWYLKTQNRKDKITLAHLIFCRFHQPQRKHDLTMIRDVKKTVMSKTLKNFIVSTIKSAAPL